MTDKVHILSTRPLDPSFAEQAAEQGIVLESLSFIDTDAITDEALVTKIAALSLQPITAVFTSMNAVDAVAQGLGTRIDKAKGVNTEAGDAPAWKIFCLGSATLQRVRENFGNDHIAGLADSAADLAKVILTHKEIKEIVFFCGDQRRDELPEQLKNQGLLVHEIVVYKTILTPHILERAYEGIVFFSPSAVNSFFSVNTFIDSPRPDKFFFRNTILFAIGNTTAEAIRAHCGNPVILSASPGKNKLIRQAIDYFQTKNIRQTPNV